MTRDAKDAVRQERAEILREYFKVGDTVYTQLKSVSRSGMSRVIQVVKLNCANGQAEPLWFGYGVAKLLDLRYDHDREGVKISGCGMDMGFEIVYQMGRALFPKGFGEKCLECGLRPDSAEHAQAVQGIGRMGHGLHRCTFRGRNGDKSGWDNDGGYALKQRWL